jgi:hypothetical protein
VFTRAARSTYGDGPYVGDLVKINLAGTEEVELTRNLTEVAGRCAHALVYGAGAPRCEAFAITRLELIPAGGVGLTWQCQAGIEYEVYYSGDLETWAHDLPGGRLTAPTGANTLSYVDTASPAVPRFYRVGAACSP